jgi:lipopolysaccharide/colanic/teichoic acid biosynthesis glycosyltransferase
VKRTLDVGLSLLVLVLFAPLIIVTAVLVRIAIGSPIMFTQPRPGLAGKVFWIYKFRTMSELVDAEDKLLPDDQRLSRFGRILRATSLDELPTLWNVLNGDMSLVGPRPLLVEYVPLYSESQARRHEVRPGVTGWAQVNGRNSVSWDDRLAMDVWYVENRSLLLDLRIMLLTLVKVIAREGINAEGEATMKRFEGTDE